MSALPSVTADMSHCSSEQPFEHALRELVLGDGGGANTVEEKRRRAERTGEPFHPPTPW
jgi:hypothetical protein